MALNLYQKLYKETANWTWSAIPINVTSTELEAYFHYKSNQPEITISIFGVLLHLFHPAAFQARRTFCRNLCLKKNNPTDDIKKNTPKPRIFRTTKTN
jgi:hypothetical protein